MFVYLFLYVASMTLPGFLLGRCIGFADSSWRYCFPLSLGLMILNVFVAKLLGFSPAVLLLFVFLQLSILFVKAGVDGGWFSYKKRRIVSSILTIAGDSIGNNRDLLLITAGIFVPLSMYLIWVGPYMEVPSDFWEHVSRIQDEYTVLIGEGRFSGFENWQSFFGKEAGYWYALQAFYCVIADIGVESTFAAQSFVNSIALLGAVYLFTARVLQGGEAEQKARYIIAALSVFFFLMHFGTSVFSFVRYYAFGAVFPNYIVYLIFVLTLLDVLLGSIERVLHRVAMLVVLLCIMAVIHVQEVLFSVTLGYALVAYAWLNKSVLGQESLEGVKETGPPLSARQLNWLFYSTTLAMIAGVMIAHFALTRHDPLAFDRMMTIERLLPFLKNLYVLNPNGQLYQTFTPWGYLVLALFFLFWKKVRNNPVLVCGMLSPLYTVLNPVFTDVFLRLSWPELLWRALYIVPFPLAAAVIFYHGARYVLKGERPVKVFYGILICVLLVFLLFPMNSTYYATPYSRIYTLSKVLPENDYRHWDDLYRYLNELNTTYKILTDPVTGYTVRALTRHDYSGAKFSRVRWGGYNEFSFEEYTLKKYTDYNGWLFIVNRRDGGYSKVGEISGHWNAVQREVSRYYDDDLIDFIENHEEVFVHQWGANGIDVYRVVLSGEMKQES